MRVVSIPKWPFDFLTFIARIHDSTATAFQFQSGLSTSQLTDGDYKQGYVGLFQFQSGLSSF